MAGLLAAHVLRRLAPEVHEAQPTLPDNHTALLRFRSDACSRATNIPFRRVLVLKAIYDSKSERLVERANLALSNLYSYKVAGCVMNRSILNLDAAERYIAPVDFTSQMSVSVDLKFGSVAGKELLQRDSDSEPIISTIPMPVMMKLFDWPEQPAFNYRKIWSSRFKLPECHVHQTVYYPSSEFPFYRASITGDILMVEYIEQVTNAHSVMWASLILEHMGIPVVPEFISLNEQAYGKIVSSHPDICRRFILFLTDRHRIYSLGRFATWRQLLLDDVVNDVFVIERLMNCRDGYQKQLGALK